MKTTSFKNLIAASIERTKVILFRPFSLRKVLTLILVAALAGALPGGGGGGNNQENSQPASQSVQTQTATPTSSASFAANAPAAPAPASPNAGLIILLVILGIGLGFVFAWVSARFSFVWLYDILRNVSEIRAPFRDYKTEGNSLFKFRLCLIAAGFGLVIVFGILLATIVGFSNFTFDNIPNLSGVKAFLIFIIGLLFAASLVAFTAFLIFADDFVVTIMFLDRCRFKEAWPKAVALYQSNTKDFWQYFLLKVLLGLGGFIFQFIVGLIAGLAILLAGAIVFGILYLLLVAILKLQVVFNIFAVILAIPFFLAALFALLTVSTTVAVFFRNFSLHFLSSLKAGYEPLPIA